MEQDADYYNVEGLTHIRLLAMMIGRKPTDSPAVNRIEEYYFKESLGGFDYNIEGVRVRFSILDHEPQITIHGTPKQREFAAKNLPKILQLNRPLTKLTLEQNAR